MTAGRAAAAIATLMLTTPVVAQAGPPAASTAADIAAIQQQLKQLRQDYDAKISDLEARLKVAEDRANAAQSAAAAPPTVTAPPVQQAAAEPAPGADEVKIAEVEPEPEAKITPANASNPGVSVVLNGNYVATSHDPSGARIPGFSVADGAGLFPRGLSLGESEITLAANVDPYLSANLTASFDRDDSVSVEEAYIQTTALPGGFTLKAGRMFSAIGYLNERHAHNWSFIDMSLPYRALLGNQYGDDGVQVKWLAPTPFFLEFGGELFRGDAFPAANGDHNKPGTQTAFVHFGADISDSSSFLGGLSYLHARGRNRMTDVDTFEGTDDLGIASLVYKWAPGGNVADRNFTLSAEYFFNKQDGRFNSTPVNRDQTGWYAQGVYQWRKGWSGGIRYARLDSDAVPTALIGSSLDPMGHNPSALSGLLEYDSSEFGRFRVQYTHDMAERRSNDLLMLQYTVVYGPHGAHRY